MTTPEQQGLFEPPDTGADTEADTGSAPGAGGPDQSSRLRTTAGFTLAEEDPVAAVQLIGALPHLDRPFEYAVTADTAAARPGTRVKVRFAGKEMDGIVVARGSEPSTDRPLAPLRRLVSEDVVMSPAMLRICREVADRGAGTIGDVLRLALPPRHARAERADRTDARDAQEPDTGEPTDPSAESDPDPLAATRYAGLPALIARAGDSEGPVPRAGIVLEPVDAWTTVATDAVAALDRHHPGAGALVIAPDQRDVHRVAKALRARGLQPEVLLAADGPEKRYRAFLRILRGASRIVVGTRSAAFAPVRDLALMVLWDEADDLLEEPRAPYPHTRTVLECRSAEERAALLLLSASRSPRLQALADAGYLRMLEPVPAPLGTVRPRIAAMDDYLRERDGGGGRNRIPGEAMRVIREGITRGPVLVQVPRSGYVPAVSCTFCGTRCLCPTCSAVLALAGRDGPLQCTVCGRREDGYRCPECDRTRVRAVVIGSTRTAEELRRAFPDAPFHIAGGAHGTLADDAVEDGAIVVSTPGAEPAPPDGYAAAVLLDADAMLARAAYDADVEAVRRWQNAVALVQPHDHGGEVLVVGTSTLPAVRDLVAHRSRQFLDRVLTDRQALDLPPFSRVAEIVGDRAACRAFLESAQLPDGTDVFGPVDGIREDRQHEEQSRVVLRIDPARARELAAALQAGVAHRSAHKAPGSLRVRLDPPAVF
ncbi:MAG: primosomal protein N' [Brachybacterium sp.]|nr:primosomal protein N' [Brachybacterium sp.]